MIHIYCHVVKAGFYSDVVECLPVDPATWVQLPAGIGKICFALRQLLCIIDCLCF